MKITAALLGLSPRALEPVPLIVFFGFLFVFVFDLKTKLSSKYFSNRYTDEFYCIFYSRHIQGNYESHGQ